MKNLLFIVTILFASHSFAAKAPDLAIIYRYGEQSTVAQFYKSKSGFETTLRLPDGKTYKGHQSHRSMYAIKRELAKLEANGFRKECSRNHIAFLINEGKQFKNYGTCIGARDRQAITLATLFNISISSLLN
jgi:hypothetical protein